MVFKNTEEIKRKIVEAHRLGLCDSDGNSDEDENGRAIAPQKRFNSQVRTYVYRNGQMVLKE